MNQIVFAVFGMLSFSILIIALYVSVKMQKNKDHGKKVFSSLHVFTFGVFISTVLVFIPIYYLTYDFGDSLAIFRPLLISFHHAFRVFILDGEFDAIRDAVTQLGKLQHIVFSVYAASLYVIAPILTFSNVLSLFKNLKNEIRFSWHRKRPFYIFSELNEMSINLAESITEDKDISDPVIAFTDVFEQNEEAGYEILLKAHDINAILLKKDIVRLNIRNKKSRVEFFLIGKNESENVEQAIKLTQEYKNECQNRPISVFIYSSQPSVGYIVDSIDKGEYILDNTLKESINENPEVFLKEKLYSKKTIDSGFYIRRIDCVEALAQKTLRKRKIIDAIFKDNKDKTISITILGMGSYGKEFLKNALTLYQIYGYKVEVNVFDTPSTENGVKKDILKKLGHEWPEIITDPKSKSFIRNEEGDSNYDIQFFDDVDCFTTDFDYLFEQSSPFIERLKRTQAAFVSLGDDYKNIDAAVMLRALFDRVNQISDPLSCSEPLIYSVVFDDKKACNLNCNQNSGGIVNCRGQSYQIDFIGNLRDQYSYARIKEKKALEDKAMRYHLDWLRTDSALWDNDILKDKNNLVKAIRENTEAYMKYEYFRKSSIARAVHEELLDYALDYVDLHKKEGHSEKCLCPVCARKAITEHMRWNAYMRTIGYRYSPVKNDRAKVHDKLVPQKLLSETVIYKDL